MIKNRLAALAVTGTAALAPLGVPAPAQADDRPCINNTEYDRIEEGLLKSSAQDIIGGNGWLIQQTGVMKDGWMRQTRGYNWCHGIGHAQIGYRSWQGSGPYRVVWKNP